MEWEHVHAELTNKVRWSISTTAAAAGINYTYSEAMACSNVVAGDLVKLMKLKYEKPDLRISVEEVRRILTN